MELLFRRERFPELRLRCLAAGFASLLFACESGAGDVVNAGVFEGPDAGSPDAVAPIVPFDAGPTDIPLTVAQLPAGFGLTLPFALGDAGPLVGLLDTGSSGIQVVESALTPEALAAIQLGVIRVELEFGSGITAIGTVGSAVVTLGDRTTPQPIPVLVYQSFTCQSGGACAVLDGGAYSFDLFKGYPAIVGVGFRNASAHVAFGLGSPIPQLPGQPSFIVEAPNFGGDAGTLHIGPSADELVAYSTIQLPAYPAGGPLANGTPSWNDLAIPACVDDVTAGQDYCANAVLDTGASATFVYLTTETGYSFLPPGSNVDVTIGQATAPVGEFDVTVAATPQPGLDEFDLGPTLPGTANSLNLGLTPFFRYNVYFNQSQGLIGLVAH